MGRKKQQKDVAWEGKVTMEASGRRRGRQRVPSPNLLMPRKTSGQETGWMNAWFHWKTLDAMDSILLWLGNLVCSHIISAVSLLRMCMCIRRRHLAGSQTNAQIKMFSTCYPQKTLAKVQSYSQRREKKESAGGSELKGCVCLCLVCGLSSFVNRAAAPSMLACYYLIKNWWLLHRGFKLFCL